ncbi:MAG: hypothetical protein H8E44_12830 [Planctomycetes bacterium]|nr:hypothetical protein [Planctomycetota bacterium]
MMIRTLLVGLLTVTSCGYASAMELGTNFWDVGWGTIHRRTGRRSPQVPFASRLRHQDRTVRR